MWCLTDWPARDGLRWYSPPFPRITKLWLTVYPKKYAHGFCFAVLCCGYTLTVFPISIRLALLALGQSLDWIWINTSCEFIMNDCITTTKQSTTKPCAYFLGYIVWLTTLLKPNMDPIVRISSLHPNIDLSISDTLVGFTSWAGMTHDAINPVRKCVYDYVKVFNTPFMNYNMFPLVLQFLCLILIDHNPGARLTEELTESELQ